MPIAANVALKIVFVWGFGLGIAGIALGTSLAAWVNVGALTVLAVSRKLLRVDDSLKRAIVPTILAAAAAAAGAFGGARLGAALAHGSHLADVAALGFAGLLGMAGYGAVTLALRNRLPLGRFARA